MFSSFTSIFATLLLSLWAPLSLHLSLALSPPLSPSALYWNIRVFPAGSAPLRSPRSRSHFGLSSVSPHVNTGLCPSARGRKKQSNRAESVSNRVACFFCSVTVESCIVFRRLLCGVCARECVCFVQGNRACPPHGCVRLLKLTASSCAAVSLDSRTPKLCTLGGRPLRALCLPCVCVRFNPLWSAFKCS